MNERKSARGVRLKKEVRAMFWPWCAVVIAGALPVLLPHSLAKTEPWSTINVLSFFFGLPLLATLPLGNEFRDRTLSLWLTQPSSRRQLWIEKTSVMFVALLSAGLVSGIGLFFVLLPQLNITFKMLAAAYVIITAALATFWTLTARSTIGGFVLIIGILYLFYLFIGHVIDPPYRGQAFAAFSSTPATITAITVFTISISGVMLWLGAWKLARYEATGGSSGEDLLMAGPSVMPQALAGWFRCRPSGAFLNLIRKELRLLRPLWLISPLVVMYVSGLAMFGLLPTPPTLFPQTALEWALLGPLLAVCIAIAGLAGMLSLGEERASGTQAWHMTLPLSARRQWLSRDDCRRIPFAVSLHVRRLPSARGPFDSAFDPDPSVLLVRVRGERDGARCDLDHPRYRRDHRCQRGWRLARRGSGADHRHSDGACCFVLPSEPVGFHNRHRVRPYAGALAISPDAASRAGAELPALSNAAGRQRARDVTMHSAARGCDDSVEFFGLRRLCVLAVGAVLRNPTSTRPTSACLGE